MRNITKIIIHCSATAEGRNFTVAQIDQCHRQRGFRCIGYHYVIYLDGSVVPGRPLYQTGAHCAGWNSCSIGICYVGGVDASGNPKDTRTQLQREALISLVRRLKDEFPRATVHGHNEFAPKACPSFNVKNDPDLCAI